MSSISLQTSTGNKVRCQKTWADIGNWSRLL